MKQFFQNTFTKIKDYFTANNGRKIFFFGILFGLTSLVLYTVVRLILPQLVGQSLYYALAYLKTGLWYIILICLVVAGIGTLWDSMYTRYLFLKKIRDMQYTHLKEVYEKQEAGESVEMTATFSEEETKYLRRRKWGFIFIIMFKLLFVIALFSLLLGV